MVRRPILITGLTALFVAFLMAGAALFAQDQLTDARLEAVVGKYQGITEAPPVKAPAVCDLKLEGGRIVGTLQLGHELLLVVGASLSGNVLTLDLDVNGQAVPLVGVLKDGRFQGTALGETIVMTRVDPTGKVLASQAPWAPIPSWRF